MLTFTAFSEPRHCLRWVSQTPTLIHHRWGRPSANLLSLRSFRAQSRNPGHSLGTYPCSAAGVGPGVGLGPLLRSVTKENALAFSEVTCPSQALHRPLHRHLSLSAHLQHPGSQVPVLYRRWGWPSAKTLFLLRSRTVAESTPGHTIQPHSPRSCRPLLDLD